METMILKEMTIMTTRNAQKPVQWLKKNTWQIQPTMLGKFPVTRHHVLVLFSFSSLSPLQSRKRFNDVIMRSQVFRC
ncbi:hypothetical protein AC249_AIPGENE25468 [Exaiptasia diaphana]|nr:hypothetical protein AC249_AIPGENE25468 [Exaiptasia diaphana]